MKKKVICFSSLKKKLRLTCSDKRLPSPGTPSTVVAYYMADVRSCTDYYAFGAEMPGRVYSSDSYRYGYNGAEKDNEISGNGNSYTTEYRQLDVRLGRWLSYDPKPNASESPYASMLNNPIVNIDPLGDTVGVDKSFKENKIAMKALKRFMKTKEGQDFIGQYASKGQKIAGHTYTEDGVYQKKGMDLNLTSGIIESGGAGETSYEIADNRLKLQVNLIPDLKERTGSFMTRFLTNSENNFKEGYPAIAPENTGCGTKTLRTLSDRMEILATAYLSHEFFIHVNMFSLEWSETKSISADIRHHAIASTQLYFNSNQGQQYGWVTSMRSVLSQANADSNAKLSVKQISELLGIGLYHISYSKDLKYYVGSMDNGSFWDKIKPEDIKAYSKLKY